MNHIYNKLECPEQYVEYFETVMKYIHVSKFVCQKESDPCKFTDRDKCPVHGHNDMKGSVSASVDMFFLDIHVGDILEVFDTESSVTIYLRVIPLSFKDSIFPVLKIKKKELCHCHLGDYMKK